MTWNLGEVVATFGYLLAIILVPRVVRERRQTGTTFAWLLAIGLFPFVGVPLYFLLGGRTIRRRLHARAVRRPIPAPQAAGTPLRLNAAAEECARTLCGVGAPPPVPAHGLTFFTEGVEAYQALLRAFDEARHHIHVQTFILGRDTTGRAIVKKLAERAAAGIEVRLLVDGFGAFPFFYRFTAPVHKAGGEARIFHPTFPVWRALAANLRNHRKMVIIDGRSAIVGGMNLKREYLGPQARVARWHDSMFRLEGPAVTQLQTHFIEDWLDAGGRPIRDDFLFPPHPAHPGADGHPVQVVPSGPDLPRRPLLYGVLSALHAARREVRIITPYFVPEGAVSDALKLARARGCRVQILVPHRSNHTLVDWAGRTYLDEMLAAGAEVYQSGAMLHTKMVLVDDSVVVAGSANMDGRSFLLNFEIDLFLYGPREVRAAGRIADALFAQAACLDPAQFAARGAVRHFGEDVCRLFSPLL